MSPLSDRRARIRYEVVGTLRGTLETVEIARLVEISLTGARIEASTPMTVGVARALQVMLEGPVTRVSTRVRHLSKIGQETENATYAIGLEFVSPSEALLTAIARLSNAHFDS